MYRCALPVTMLLAISACAPTLSATAQQAGTTGLVEIHGKQLFRNGQPWIPHGFYQIAFEVAPANLARADNHFWTVAQDNYSPQEYTDMFRAGADTVRIQVAQSGADPQSPAYDDGFVRRTLDAVRAARRIGLTVILCVQGESHVPNVKPLPLPGDGTRRIWKRFAHEFANDPGVMFELLNEPQPPPTRENWARWKDAMTRTVQVVREEGAHNVLIADGLLSGQVLDGAPLLDDDQVAYASHPYATKQSGEFAQTAKAWDKKFGSFSRRAPVIITEWHFGGFFCNAQTPQATLDFLHYIRERNIGVVVGTWDWQPSGFGNARWNFPDGRFSSFSDLACHQPGYGLGQVITDYYKTDVIPKTPE